MPLLLLYGAPPATQVTAEVEAAASPNSWTLFAGANKVVAVNTPDDGDTSAIDSTTTNATQQRYDVSAIAERTETIDFVRIRARCRSTAGGGSFADFFTTIIPTLASEAGTVHTATETYADYDSDFAIDPGTLGGWAWSRLVPLQVEVENDVVVLPGSDGNVRCTSLTVEVHFQVAGGETTLYPAPVIAVPAVTDPAFVPGEAIIPQPVPVGSETPGGEVPGEIAASTQGAAAVVFPAPARGHGRVLAAAGTVDASICNPVLPRSRDLTVVYTGRVRYHPLTFMDAGGFSRPVLVSPGRGYGGLPNVVESRVTSFGRAPSSIFAIETRAVGLLYEYRVRTTLAWGTVTQTDYTDWDGAFESSTIRASDYDIEWSAEEFCVLDLVLTETIPGVIPSENIQVVDGHVTARFRFDITDGLTTVPLEFTRGMSYWEVTARAMDYEVVYAFGGIPLHEDGGATWLCTDETLVSQYGSVAPHDGYVRMQGTVNSIGYFWTGTDANAIYNSVPPDYPNKNWGAVISPFATATFSPSWALEAKVELRDYRTGSLIDLAIEHRAIGAAPDAGQLIATFQSGSGAATIYRYPTSGLLHNCQTTIFGGEVELWNIDAFFNYTTISRYVRLGNPDEALAGAVNVSNPWGTAPVTGWISPRAPSWFRIQRAALDTYGTWRSPPTERLQSRLFPPFTIGSIQFNSTHEFQLFRNSANFAKWGDDPFFEPLPPGYGTAVTLSTVAGSSGNATRAVVATAPVMVSTAGGTAMGKVLEHWGFRYGTLRVRSDTAGARLRLGIGSGPWVWGWAWDLTVAAADTWEDFNLDLIAPTLKSGLNESFQPAIMANKLAVHPYTFWSHVGGAYAHGAPVTLDLRDAATYDIELLTGTRRTGATTRSEILMLSPSAIDVPEDADNMRVFVNGAHGFLFEPSTGAITFISLSDAMDKLITRIDTTSAGLTSGSVNDTGIVVRKCAHWLMAFGSAGRWDQTELRAGLPFGRRMAGDVPGILWGQLAGPTAGFYGMGDLSLDVPAYATVCRLNFMTVLNGELLGVVTGSPSDVAAAVIRLHDDNTGAVEATASPDLDGFYRLRAHRGRIHPVGNVSQANEWSGFPEVYTTQGLKMNAWWLAGSGQAEPEDDAGYVTDRPILGGRRSRFEIRNDWQTLRDFVSRVVEGGIAVLQSMFGEYYRATVDSGRIRVRRADHTTIPFVLSALATAGPDDSEPELSQDWRTRILLGFSRGGDVLETVSTDRGATWEAPVMAIAGGRGSETAIDPQTGIIYRAARVGTEMHATLQFPGEVAPSAAFVCRDAVGTPLGIEEDGFGIAWAQDGQRRLTGAVRFLGDSSPTDMQSFDNGVTWEPQ